MFVWVGEPDYCAYGDQEKDALPPSIELWPLWLTSHSSTTWTIGVPMDRASSSAKQLQPVLQQIQRNQINIGATAGQLQSLTDKACLSRR